MLVLAFDTSTPAVTVAVASVDPASGGVSTLAAAVEIAANHHGELLAPLIETVLAAAGVVGELGLPALVHIPRRAVVGAR